MKKKILALIVGFCVLSCRENENAITHDITLVDSLVIETSSKYRLAEGQGIDSYVAYLISDKNDTFFVEYGQRDIINSLYNPSPPVFPLDQKSEVTRNVGKEPSADEVLFSEYPEEDREQKIFDKHYFIYDTINRIVAKLVQPKRIGDGVTGVHFPKLRDGKSMTIFAYNLDSSRHKEALKMFRTIKYNSNLQ